MPSYRLIVPALAAVLLSAPALAQGVKPHYSADQLAAILKPSKELTRSLIPGEGAEPGTQGSGVLPDLNVLFPFNSAELTPEAKTQLDALGQALQRDDLRSYKFLIGGHTDIVGTDPFNQSLSQRRAAAVVGYLSDTFGIARDRLEAVGYGKKQLADPTDPKSGKNRRVEVRTLE